MLISKINYLDKWKMSKNVENHCKNVLFMVKYN